LKQRAKAKKGEKYDSISEVVSGAVFSFVLV
jgi:hypothetical protein